MFPLFAADPTRVDPLLLLLAALALDAGIGDPAAIFRRLPHPVVLLGLLIGRLEQHLNRQDHSDRDRRLGRIATVFVVVGVAAGAGAILDIVAARPVWGAVAETLGVTALLARRRRSDPLAAAAPRPDREGPAARRA